MRNSKNDNPLKDVCFKCGTFDPAMGARRYKCAINGKCPGLDWSMAKRARIIQQRKQKK
jgi:hypothetical protein